VARKFNSRWAALGIAATLFLAGCGGDEDNEEPAREEGVSGTFVGKVAGTGALIAVVASEPTPGSQRRDTRVYVCDGDRIFEWFTGKTTGNEIHLESDDGDASVQVALGPRDANGTVTLPNGEEQRFKASAASGIAGLYIGHVSKTGVATARSETGTRLEGSARGNRLVTGKLYPPDGDPVVFRFTGRDFIPVDFRLIALPSGELEGARAEPQAELGFRLWGDATTQSGG
jgi:hypothetical protein